MVKMFFLQNMPIISKIMYKTIFSFNLNQNLRHFKFTLSLYLLASSCSLSSSIFLSFA